MGWECRIRAYCLEGVEVETANELPNTVEPCLLIPRVAVVGSPEWNFDGGGAQMGLLLYLLYKLGGEFIFVLDLPAILVQRIIVFLILGLDAAPVYSFPVLLEQLPESVIANLLEVVLMVYFLHVKFPGLHYSVLLLLGDGIVMLKQLRHEGVHQFGDVLRKGVVGFDILIEVLDY